MDVLATVLEEMPPFPEKESSGLLNLLKKKRPGRVPDNNPEIKLNNSENNKSGNSGNNANTNNSASADLIGLDNNLNGNNLVGNLDAPTDNLKKVRKNMADLVL